MSALINPANNPYLTSPGFYFLQAAMIARLMPASQVGQRRPLPPRNALLPSPVPMPQSRRRVQVGREAEGRARKIAKVSMDAKCPRIENEDDSVIFSVLPDLRGNTQKWSDLQMILNPKPIEQQFPADYYCPISCRLMCEPVITSDGYAYEREAIEKWLETHNTSPLGGAELKSKMLTPVLFVKKAVCKLLDQHPELRDSKEWYLPESWVEQRTQACAQGEEAAIREMVDRDRRLLVHTLNGKTTLQLASESGNASIPELVVELLEKRERGLALAALLQADEQGHLPLHKAILANRDGSIVLKIMAWMGKAVDLVAAPQDWPIAEGKKPAVMATLNTALMWSVCHGDPVKAACLLRLHASPNAFNGRGKSVLYLALLQQVKPTAQQGDAGRRGQVTQLLLQNGADPNALVDGEMDGPLHFAIERDLLTTALELTRAGARLNTILKNGKTPLHVVAGKPTTELADALWGQQLPSHELEAVSDQEGYTALHYAARSGSSAMLRWLVARGAQVMAVDANKRSILHVAALYNQKQFVEEAVKLMKESSTEVLSSLDCDGNTPLHLAAAQTAASAMVSLLVELGVPSSQNSAGQSPRQVAELLCHSAVVSAYDKAVAAKKEALVAQQPLMQLMLHRLEQQEGQLRELEEEVLRLRQPTTTRENLFKTRIAQEQAFSQLQHHHPKYRKDKQKSEIEEQTCSFLKYVARGDREKAKAVIEKNPDVLLCQGVLVDRKRTFKCITGFQYAVWSLDWRMWMMLLEYMPKEQAVLQYRKINTQFYEHSRLYSGQDIIEKYQALVNCLHTRGSPEETHLVSQIAEAQRQMPAHMLREYAGEHFHDTDFEQADLMLEYSIHPSESSGMWVRGQGDLEDIAQLDQGRVDDVALDLKALKLLLLTRQRQRAELVRTLVFG